MAAKQLCICARIDSEQTQQREEIVHLCVIDLPARRSRAEQQQLFSSL